MVRMGEGMTPTRTQRNDSGRLYVDSAAHRAHHDVGVGQRLSCERERFLRFGSPVA
jgi:hypothetical protein